MSTHTYLFGPVNSRRLGISLGVDMVPPKTCTLNCAYCECGATTHLTLTRREYFPAHEIIAELSAYLASSPKLDYVTFGGSGEPTLNTALGEVLVFLKANYPQYRTALLTNGTLLHLPEVRREVSAIDLVLPSLDAVSQEAFERINGPAAGLDAKDVVAGLIDFAHEFRGEIWLEVFIVEGINDSDEEIAMFKDVITRINPARVQLNALDRPGTFAWVKPARPQRLAEIARALLPLPVEVIARRPVQSSDASAPTPNAEVNLLAALSRRPLTLEESARIMGTSLDMCGATLTELIARGSIERTTVAGTEFFRAIQAR